MTAQESNEGYISECVVWLFVWLIRWEDWAKAGVHILQANGFIPWCIFVWLVSLEASERFRAHKAHTNNFFQVWWWWWCEFLFSWSDWKHQKKSENTEGGHMGSLLYEFLCGWSDRLTIGWPSKSVRAHIAGKWFHLSMSFCVTVQVVRPSKSVTAQIAGKWFHLSVHN